MLEIVHIEGLKRKTAIVDIDKIVQFGVYNRKLWRKDGGFKTFGKVGWVRTEDDYFSGLSMDRIRELKTQFKGKLNAEKIKLEQYKETKRGSQLREAIDWTYRINKGA